jgi:uncharacterized membrane protein YqjE
MIRNPNESPSLGTLLRKTVATGIGALQNRGELVLVELQEERSRLIRLVILGIVASFLVMMTVLLITGAIIFLLPEGYRFFAVGGFALLYLAGTVWTIFALKALLTQIPFGTTLSEFKKDAELAEAFDE